MGFLVESAAEYIYGGLMKNSDSDETDQRESAGLFNKTHWSVVMRAKDNSYTALDILFNQYRDPMVHFLLKCGRSTDQAEDLVQGFCAKLLDPKRTHFLTNVSEQNGKFRTFLLSSLKNYIGDETDKKNTLKRGKGIFHDSLDEVDSDDNPLVSPASSSLSADLEYDRAWAQTILRNSLSKLKNHYTSLNQVNLYNMLEPVLHEDDSVPTYCDIATRLGMTEGAIKVAALRMRRKLQDYIRNDLMQTVSNEVEFEEELAYLISLFGKTHV